jgi:alkanesulfonate monooxygenase SsuD/methylene tetrahydromethanopterin reductase-like flavin-dependent oxidoreductase (luciferase family)
MALAIIGGQPARFVAALRPLPGGGPPRRPRPIDVAVEHQLARVHRRDEPAGAADLAFPAHKVTMDRIGRERGWPPMTRGDFDVQSQLHGAYAVGSPHQVAEKILWQHERFGHDRFLLQLTVGTMPHEDVMRAIGSIEVAPRATHLG